MLPSALYDRVGTPDKKITRLNSPACTYPYRRFAAALTDDNARLGATVARYTFDVGLSHSFLRTGLSRRSLHHFLLIPSDVSVHPTSK